MLPPSGRARSAAQTPFGRALGLTLGLVLGLLGAVPMARAGRLDDAGDAARGGGAPRDDDDDDEGHCEGAACEALGQLVLQVLGAPWTLPYHALEQETLRPFRYAPAPYLDGGRGLLRMQDVDGGGAPVTTAHRAEVELEGAYQVGGLVRSRLSLRWRNPSQFEPAAELLGYLEPNGSQADLALLGHYSLGFRFAQRQGLAFRTGLGGLSFHDARGVRGGAYVSWGVEAFVARPWVLGFDVALGVLGQAMYGRIRCSLGYVLGMLELFAAFDHVSLSSENVTSRLTGPALGIRLWL